LKSDAAHYFSASFPDLFALAVKIPKIPVITAEFMGQV
jgi:hypothetical protein